MHDQMHDQLFVSGNNKGSLLFDALAPHHESAHCVNASPDLLTRASTAAFGPPASRANETS